MKKLLAILTVISCVSAFGQTISLVQKQMLANNETCNLTCPAITTSAIGTGDLLVVAVENTGNGSAASNISSISCAPSSCGSWVVPGAACRQWSSSTGGTDCAYVLSSGAGATSVTVTMSASSTGSALYFREYHATAGATFNFDNGASTLLTTSCTSCVSPSLTLSGTDDVVVAGGSPYHGFSAMSSPYGDVDVDGSEGTIMGDVLNTSSGTGATITQSGGGGIGALYTIAFKSAVSGGGTITGSGTANTVPMFTGSTTLSNSVIAQSNGNVGIGTTTPGARLDIEGVSGALLSLGGNTSSWTGADLSVGRSTSGAGVGNSPAIQFSDGATGHAAILQAYQGAFQFFNYVGGSSWQEPMVINGNGSVGIGTLNPVSALHVVGGITSQGIYNTMPIPSVGTTPVYSALFGDTSQSSGLIVGTLPYNGTWLQSAQYDSANSAIHLLKPLYLQPSGGNVGIGTTAPAYTLDVAGSIHASAGVYFPDNTQQTTAWTGVLCGGDYAEAVNASGPKKSYEPGDVLVLTEGNDDEVQKSSEPYSTMVAGIFATKPGVIGRRESLPKDAQELPMAMVGIVPTKVTTENGPIRKGDLLVTSSAAGYAMKGTDRSRMLGAVIGKAMGTLDSGTGVIEILVALQ